MKKFEFTGETKVNFNGTVLHRIRACADIDIGFHTVKAGELGGWLEKEENLSHDGNAWVSGDAWVHGNAQVYGDAVVCGDAWVHGNAQVYGDAWVSKTEHYFVMGPMGSRNAFTTFTRDKEGEIKVACGCFYGTVEQFLDKVTQTHGNSKHARVYRAAVQVALEQIDATPIEEEDDET